MSFFRSTVMAMVGISNREECASLLRAVEAGLRADPTDENLRRLRAILLNLPRRARIEDWGGWE